MGRRHHFWGIPHRGSNRALVQEGRAMKRAFACIFGLAAAAASGQTTSHKHYEKSAEADKPAPTGEVAPRLQSLGRHTFPVRTKSATAQLFVNQGVNLAYGFNHAQARPAL